MTDDAYRFTVDRIRSQFSKGELIESLKAYSRLHNAATFGMRDYDAWPGRASTSDTIGRYFGSWGKALQAAELRTSRGHKLDPKAMVTAFKDCWRKHGSVPSVNQLAAFLETGGYPFRYKSYLNFFGGLGRLDKMVVDVQKGVLPESKMCERQKSGAAIRRTVSYQMRTVILKRDRYRCVKCGANPKDNELVSLEVDHIIPVARGGLSTLDNLQTLCLPCNQGKKDRED